MLKVFALSESSHSMVLTADEKVRGPHLSLPELPQKHRMLTQDLSLPELPHLSLPDLKADNAIRNHNQSGNEKDGPLCTQVCACSWKKYNVGVDWHTKNRSRGDTILGCMFMEEI